MPGRWARGLIKAANGCVCTSVVFALLAIVTGHAGDSGWIRFGVLVSLGYGIATGSVLSTLALFVLTILDSVVRYQRQGTPPSVLDIAFALAYLLGAVAMFALPREKRSMLNWPQGQGRFGAHE